MDTTGASGGRLGPTAALSVVIAVAFLPWACGGSKRARTVRRPPASPASTSPATTTAPPIAYQVKRGDTLASIAQRFGVTPSAILALNQLANPDRLTEGQVLQVPRPPPVNLAVDPPRGQAGDSFQLALTGAKPSETVTFDVSGPNGRKFTGPPHTATPEGAVQASYQTSPEDAAGTYGVDARGGQGTAAHATFIVDAPTTTTR